MMSNVSYGQVITASIALPLAYYFLFKWRPRYFKKLGINGPFSWPLVGNMVYILRKGFLQANLDWNKSYGRIIGVYEGSAPTILLADPDLLQQVLIKDFHIFPDRRSLQTGDEIIDTFLTVLKGDHWRHVRHLMAPTFSTGKLKRMIKDINDCAFLLVDNLTTMTEEGKIVNMKDRCGEYTMDVIARTAFSIELDTQKNPNSPFVLYAKKLFQPTSFIRPVLLIFIFLPFMRPLMRKFKISFFPPDSMSFFKEAVVKAIESRKQDKDQQHRTDFLQLMLNSNEDQEETEQEIPSLGKAGNTWDRKGLTETEILSQSILFLLAGYETTATTLSFVTYCLALNSECQEKLYEEVKSVVGDKETIDFETINALTYMDKCIQETQRLFPAAIRTDRQAVEDTTVGGIPIPKGMFVGIQIYVIHHDPNLWPDPEKFDPERFSEEAKATHHPMQYMPFGLGPRMCIGMRLALLELKIALALLVRKFRFLPCKETDIPMQFTKAGLLQPKNGVKLKLEFRA